MCVLTMIQSCISPVCLNRVVHPGGYPLGESSLVPWPNLLPGVLITG